NEGITKIACKKYLPNSASQILSLARLLVKYKSK
ncbi:MAG: hypothetical protein ACI9DC_005122, partial [Gammaproteobacteria bacterium]